MLALHMISLPTATFFGSQAGDTTGETEKALRPSTGSRTLPKPRCRKQFFSLPLRHLDSRMVLICEDLSRWTGRAFGSGRKSYQPSSPETKLSNRPPTMEMDSRRDAPRPRAQHY